MPARRSALEVSFPDIAEELREEEDAETVFPGRPTSAPSKRKKTNSLVEARVSHPQFFNEPLVVMLRLV